MRWLIKTWCSRNNMLRLHAVDDKLYCVYDTSYLISTKYPLSWDWRWLRYVWTFLTLSEPVFLEWQFPPFYISDTISATCTEEICIQEFFVILKQKLWNYDEILENYFLGTGWSLDRPQSTFIYTGVGMFQSPTMR